MSRVLLGKKLWVAFAIALMSPIVVISQIAISQPLTNNTSAPAKECKFFKPINLRQTKKYGIFGDDEFDTLVCGYLVTTEDERFDEKATLVYLRIIQFYDDGFKQAIDRGIANGNSVNAVIDGVYYFSLGCLKNQRIIGDEEQSDEIYIAENVQSRIINSSPQQPIVLLLSFGKRPGSQCVCCNLAKRVRL